MEALQVTVSSMTNTTPMTTTAIAATAVAVTGDIKTTGVTEVETAVDTA